MKFPRRRALAAVLLVQGWLGACTVIGSGPQVITLDEADLAAWIGRSFPVERRLLEWIDVRAERPLLTLDPGHNLLVFDASVIARERLMASSWRGRIVFESGLRWDQVAQAVRLDHVRVRSLDFGDGAAPTAPHVTAGEPGAEALARRLRAVLAEQWLDGQVIWRLDAERKSRLDRLGLAPGAVTVTARGVEITLVRAS